MSCNLKILLQRNKQKIKIYVLSKNRFLYIERLKATYIIERIKNIKKLIPYMQIRNLQNLLDRVKKNQKNKNFLPG